jgi:hypothetical protein
MKRPTEQMVEYYMGGGCAYLAIALHELMGWGMVILTDEAVYESWGKRKKYPLIAHIFVHRPDGLAVDIKGPRRREDIREDFFDLEEPHTESISLDQLRSLMGDFKPLYEYSESEVAEAKRIVGRYLAFFTG